jgi:2-oxoglutarate ferredoxin oxidoreductase subunit alpha
MFQSVRLARSKGLKVGSIKLNTLWPCAENTIRELTSNARKIIVPEMNCGQYVLEIERVTKKEVFSLTKTTGFVFSSDEILKEIERVN